MDPTTTKGLRIDLDRMAVEPVELPGAADWPGGRGTGVRILLPHAGLAWDDPATPVVFSTGPLTAAGLPACGRTYVTSRSPLTGTIFTEDAGGDFGAHLRRCGILFLHFTGKAPVPCALSLEGDRATLEPDPWRPGAGDPADGWEGGVASIGAAARSGCRFASIRFGGPWCASRGGLGLSMAARNLYRVRVRGTSAPPVADAAALARAREQSLRLVHASPALLGPCGISRFGTATLFDLVSSRRMLPSRNFRDTAFEGASALSASAVVRAMGAAGSACDGCPVACGLSGGDGTPHPSFGALTHLGPLVGNRDLPSLLAASAFCHEAGIDPVSAGATIAAWAEARGAAIDPSGLLPLLRSIVSGEGDGALLARGSREAAAALGCPDASMSVKGLELPGFDPRGALGTALSYAVSTNGGDERHAMAYVHEVLRKPVATDRFSLDGKARIVKASEDLYAAADSIGACRFAFFGASIEEYAAAFRAVTGLDGGVDALLRAGERICVAERLFNEKCGFAAADDALPGRFLDDPGSPGDGIDVPPIGRAPFAEALARYRSLRGVGEDGRLLPETVSRLGLGGKEDA